jgi:HAD superfamily hydrolase (TIGR01509 family)
LELVIFDCDGVLVDSERIAVRIDVEVLAELGVRLTEAEVVELFVGRSDEHMRLEIGRRLGRELAEGWDAPFAHRYWDAIERELEVVAGVVAVLDHLDAIPIPTCVASSGTHDKMRVTLGRTGLWDRFAGRIFSTTQVAHGKPAPDLFLHAAAAMGVEPAACAVVEDSAAGVDAALAAGMRVFAYAGSVTPRERLARAGVIVFDDMRELPALLGANGKRNS